VFIIGEVRAAMRAATVAVGDDPGAPRP